MSKEPKAAPPGGASEQSEAEASTAPAEAEAGADQQPALVINAQYIKDLSFEAPNAPQIFQLMSQHQPDISVNIDVRGQNREASLYEVDLHMKAECKCGETVAFILELIYSGVFTINVPEDQVQPVLLIECPRLLFPFARSILADATRDGGFPPLLLGPVDFVAMYQRQMEAASAGSGGGDGGTPPVN